MTPAETFRANAAAQREAASKTNLQNRRDMHERSAAAWEIMAQANDDTVEGRCERGVEAVGRVGLERFLISLNRRGFPQS